MENPDSNPNTGDAENQKTNEGAVSNIIRRLNRDYILRKGSSIFRGFGLVFSLIASTVMATNEHGDWQDFHRYEEYRYVLAIAILSTLYTGLQVLRQFHQVHYTSTDTLSPQNLAVFDFLGDQIVAYLSISSASSAVPLTNRMRRGSDNIFTDSSATAISMEFFAFISLALSALISGYKLSHQTCI